MPLRINTPPESDFTNPLGMLSDCHRRIERFLAALAFVAEQSASTGLGAGQRATLDAALRYFREAAPKHTLDEEESLFPRLRASDGAAEALALLDSLHTDHELAEAYHREVETLAGRLLADGRLSEEESRRLISVLKYLRAVYREHIRAEDEGLFPLAGRVLSGTELEAVGREMAERRGVDLRRQ
jgi:hemerythrin-like domain-containing protein